MSEKADGEDQKPAGARTGYPPTDLVELYYYSIMRIG